VTGKAAARNKLRRSGAHTMKGGDLLLHKHCTIYLDNNNNNDNDSDYFTNWITLLAV